MAKFVKIEASIPQRIIDLLKSDGNFVSEKEYNELTDLVFTDDECTICPIKLRNSIIIKLLGGSLDG